MVVVVVAIGVGKHIDPDDPVNIWLLSAFEWTQTDLQSVWLKDVAHKNNEFMLVTRDTFHFERSPLKLVLPKNSELMSVM